MLKLGVDLNRESDIKRVDIKRAALYKTSDKSRFSGCGLLFFRYISQKLAENKSKYRFPWDISSHYFLFCNTYFMAKVIAS